jgi:hypothetical protein
MKKPTLIMNKEMLNFKKQLGKLAIKYGKKIKDDAHGIGYRLLGWYYIPCCNEWSKWN